MFSLELEYFRAVSCANVNKPQPW